MPFCFYSYLRLFFVFCEHSGVPCVIEGELRTHAPSGTLPHHISHGSAIDLSNVKVRLFTRDGLLKYSADCAPSGYYFVPVYDKGAFYLEIDGPAGWAFGTLQERPSRRDKYNHSALRSFRCLLRRHFSRSRSSD